MSTATEPPDEIVARFEIRFRRYLDAEGRLVRDPPEQLRDRARLVAWYRAMLRARAFDARAIALQRTGRLGTYASALGQEAVAVGVASAMRERDVLLPSFREHGAQLWRGMTPLELFLYWGGDERGSDVAGPRQDFPICIPVGTHAPHAVGVAMAMALRHEERAAVCVLGDGATSKGDVYEALNAAGAWRLPVVFVVSNNQWAISTPRSAQTAAATLAQKAIAAGLPGEQVDGNDVLAVHEAVARALAQAQVSGPTLIEALTYRLGDHTTSDDATRYRAEDAVRAAWVGEPLGRLRRYLSALGAWSDSDEAAAVSAVNAEIDAAAAQYLAAPAPPQESMFDYTYERLPADLAIQRASALAEWHERG